MLDPLPLGPHRAFRRFFRAVLALLGLLMLGTAGYRWVEGLSTLDAVYMTVITLSTVGFGEVQPLSPAGRLFTIGLILGGVGLAAYLLGTVVAFIVSGEGRAHWVQRRAGANEVILPYSITGRQMLPC